jgi:hypothetical protein
MVEALSIVTLVTVIITGCTQLVQMYIDYKVHQKQGHTDVYSTRQFQSNCCSTIELSDDQVAE